MVLISIIVFKASNEIRTFNNQDTRRLFLGPVAALVLLFQAQDNTREAASRTSTPPTLTEESPLFCRCGRN